MKTKWDNESDTIRSNQLLLNWPFYYHNPVIINVNDKQFRCRPNAMQGHMHMNMHSFHWRMITQLT